MEKLLFISSLLFFFVSVVSSYNLPAIFTFGDSILDAGTNHLIKNCTAQADFPPYGSSFFHRPTGRFTNGRTVVDFLCQFLGIDLQKPYLEVEMEVVNGSRKAYPSNGINFASAGSGVLRETNKYMDSVSVATWKQQSPTALLNPVPVHPATQHFTRVSKQDAVLKFGDMLAVSVDILSVEWTISTTFSPAGVIPIEDQLQQFETLMKLNKIDKKLVQQSLFLFESGSNDIFDYFLAFEPPKLYPDAFVATMLKEVQYWINRVYQLGARRIVVISLGPVGCVPARELLPGAPIQKCYGKMNKMVKKYNLGLEGLVKDMGVKNNPGALGVYGAVYEVFQLFRAIPTRYGFSNTSGACCGEGALRGILQCGKEGYKICKNPNEFLFWDFFHPSEHAYKLISKAIWSGKKSRIRPINLKTLANITLGPF